MGRPREGTWPPLRQLVLSATAVVLVGLFMLGGLSRLEVDTGVKSFVPAADPAVEGVDQLARSFGGDPVVLLLESRPYELLASNKIGQLLKLEGQLSGLPDAAAVYGPGTILNQIAGQMQKLMAELSGRREAIRSSAVADAKDKGFSAADARQAGNNAVAEFDARYGGLLAQGLPAGVPTLRNNSFIQAVVKGEDGLPRSQWRFVVPNPSSVAVMVRPKEGLDQASSERLVEAIREASRKAGFDSQRITVSGSPAVVAALGDQVRNEIPLIGGTALVCVALCYLITPWTRRRRRLLPVITTMIASGLTLSALGWLDFRLSLGVVAFLPVLLGIGSYYPTYFAHNARPRIVWAVAAASAVSFASLFLSPLAFVRDLGITLGLGLLSACAVGMLLRSKSPDSDEAMASRGHGKGERVERRSSERAGSRRTRVAGGVVALTGLLGWAVFPVLPLTVDLESLAKGSPAFQDVQHVQEVLGSSGEVAVVLRGGDVTSPEAFTWMRRAQDAVISAHGDAMRPVLSLPTLLGFLGQKPVRGEVEAGLRLLPHYLVSSVVRDDKGVATLVFGVDINDARDIQALRDNVQRVIGSPPPGYDADLVGLPMLAVRAYELVSNDRYLASTVGLVGAGLVLALVTRNIRDAARAMLAAGIATGSGFIALWTAGIALNPVTVALGSLTAAVGCEFTTMLTESYRRGDHGLRRSVGLAVASSAIGYAVLTVSQLHAIREFGALLAVSVMLAYVAARFVVWLFPVKSGVEGPAVSHGNRGESAQVGVG